MFWIFGWNIKSEKLFSKNQSVGDNLDDKNHISEIFRYKICY